jgi:hypothetical protein
VVNGGLSASCSQQQSACARVRSLTNIPTSSVTRGRVTECWRGCAGAEASPVSADENAHIGSAYEENLRWYSVGSGVPGY